MKFKNGSQIKSVKSSDSHRGNRADLIGMIDDNGDAIELNVKDGTYRIIYTKEELSEEL